MERFDTRAQFDRGDELQPLPAPRREPAFGRAALGVALLTVVLYVLTGSQGLPTPETSFAARQIVAIAGPLVGIALAVTSLVRKERKGPAVATLCIVGVVPLLLAGAATIAWWSYGQGIGS